MSRTSQRNQNKSTAPRVATCTSYSWERVRAEQLKCSPSSTPNEPMRKHAHPAPNRLKYRAGNAINKIK